MGVVHIDMLQQQLTPELQKDKADFILQQDGAPALFLGNVRDNFNAELPGHSIGRASVEMTIPFFCGLHAHLT